MLISAMTDTGLHRENNQDSYFAEDFFNNVVFAVVCDGMGGAAGGNIASSVASEVIFNKVKAAYRGNMTEDSIKNIFEVAVNAANVSIFDMAKERPELYGMGTTVVAALVIDNKAHILHAGDSRAYKYTGDKLELLTIDHSLVQNLIDNGTLSEDEAKDYPYRNIITRAVGCDENIEADYTNVPVASGDILLLCTDGLTNYAGQEEIVRCLSDGIEDSARRLVRIANDNGGGDNITAVCIGI